LSSLKKYLLDVLSACYFGTSRMKRQPSW